MVKNKSYKKIHLFLGLSIKLFCIIPLANILGIRLFVFDISRRPLTFRIMHKMHDLGLINRVTEHSSIPLNRNHSSAIKAADLIINRKLDDELLLMAKVLCGSSEVDLVFKRVLAQHLSLIYSVNQYVIDNKFKKCTLHINAKYYRIFKDNPTIINPTLKVKTFFDFEVIQIKFTYFILTIGYLIHLGIQLFWNKNINRKFFKYAISIPFSWATKFRGAREFTFIIDNLRIKKEDVIFLIEYPEKNKFYQYYSRLGYFLVRASHVSKIIDFFKRSTLEFNHDFLKIIKLFLYKKKDFYIYESLISLLTSRVSWSIIVAKTSFDNYIYFNKEGKTQISTNIFFKSQSIKTHAYSQFIGGQYQICGKNSIFDQCNIHWSFLNPDYYYLNNLAMVDSMKLHYQNTTHHKVIGNIFSEKIMELRCNANYVNSIKNGFDVPRFKKVVGIFDTTYVPLEKMYSTYSEAENFLKDMIQLAKNIPDCFFIFKPSKSNQHYLTKNRYWANAQGERIVELRNEFSRFQNVIMLNDHDDVVDVISISEVVLTNCFSSPTADALLAGVPSFWYQSETNVSFSVYNKIPGLVICGFDNLLINIKNIFLKKDRQYFLKNRDFNYLIGNVEDKALTQLRLNISNC